MSSRWWRLERPSISPPTGEPLGALYLPTDTTPEELLQVIGQLRKEARDEIDRLIGFFDMTDDYISCELEHEDGNDEPVGDEEPSLGSFDRMTDQSKSWRRIGFEYMQGTVRCRTAPTARTAILWS